MTGHDRHTDRKTLRQHAAVEERAAEETVRVRFDDPPATDPPADR